MQPKAFLSAATTTTIGLQGVQIFVVMLLLAALVAAQPQKFGGCTWCCVAPACTCDASGAPFNGTITPYTGTEVCDCKSYNEDATSAPSGLFYIWAGCASTSLLSIGISATGFLLSGTYTALSAAASSVIEVDTGATLTGLNVAGSSVNFVVLGTVQTIAVPSSSSSVTVLLVSFPTVTSVTSTGGTVVLTGQGMIGSCT